MISSEITVAEYRLNRLKEIGLSRVPSQCRSFNGKDKSTRLTALN